jgi:hypothetical protein
MRTVVIYHGQFEVAVEWRGADFKPIHDDWDDAAAERFRC